MKCQALPAAADQQHRAAQFTAMHVRGCSAPQQQNVAAIEPACLICFSRLRVCVLLKPLKPHGFCQALQAAAAAAAAGCRQLVGR